MRPADLLRERNLSHEQVAALLGERGVLLARGDRKGSPVTPTDVARRVRSGDFPRSWLDALGASEDPAANAVDGGEAGAREPLGDDAAPRGRAHEQPPKRPEGAKIEPLPVPAGSQKRISGLYRGGGSLLAMQTRRTHGENAGQGIARVFDDSADPIAKLWLQAAEESPQIAKIVNAINSGGVAGDLVLAHVVLAASVIYVLGAPLPDAAFAKYSRYRVVVPAEPKPGPDGTREPEHDIDADTRVHAASNGTSTTRLG